MSFYKPPLTYGNDEINPEFNASDYNYQFNNLTIQEGDRYYLQYNRNIHLTNDTSEGSILYANTIFLYNALYVNSILLSPTVLAYLDGCTSNIELRLVNLYTLLQNCSFNSSTNTNIFLNLQATKLTITSTLALANTGVFNFDGNIYCNYKTISPTELSYLDNCSSNIETRFTYLYNLLQNCSYNSTTNTTIFSLNFQTSSLSTDSLAVSGTCTFGSSSILQLNGNISANSKTISPTELSYLDNCSSNIETRFTYLYNLLQNCSYNSSTSNTYFSLNFQTQYLTTDSLTVSGTCIFGTSSNLQINGNILCNSLTISPTELSYLDNCSSNIESRFTYLYNLLQNCSYNSTTNNTYFTLNFQTQYLTTDSLTVSGTLTVSDNLQLNGNIYCNSLTISPTELSYLDNCSSNIESRFTYLYNLLTNLTYSSSFGTSISGILNLSTVNVSGVLTLNNSIYANSTTITPTVLSRISTLTSDCQTQISSLSSSISTLNTKNTNINYNSTTNTTTISGILVLSQETDSGSLTVSGLSSLSAVNISGLLTLSNSIYANSTTISQTALSYVANLSSDCQTQLTALQTKTTNITNTSGITYISGTCQTGILNCNGATNFKSSVILSSPFVFTFLGNISANSITITPTILGYIGNLSSDCQTQLTALQTKTTNISYSSSNTAISNNASIAGNLTMGSSTSYIDLSGCTGTSSGLKVGTSTYLNASQLSSISSTSALPITYSSPTTTVNSNLLVNGTIETSSSSFPTLSTNSIGYQYSNNTSVSISGTNATLNSGTLTISAVGVYMVNSNLILSNTGTATSTQVSLFGTIYLNSSAQVQTNGRSYNYEVAILNSISCTTSSWCFSLTSVNTTIYASYIFAYSSSTWTAPNGIYLQVVKIA